MKFIYTITLLFVFSCSNSNLKRGEEAKPAVESITDSNQLTKDSLATPDSSARSLTH